jgi:hypothetical protein
LLNSRLFVSLSLSLRIWSIRKLFGWWFQRKIVLNRAKTDSLRKERERLLDDVMDTETFKVAKKILEKYAPSQLLPKYLAEQQRSTVQGTPVSRIIGGNDPLRRRTMGGPSVTPMGIRGVPYGGQQFRPIFRPQQQQAIMPPGYSKFPLPFSSILFNYVLLIINCRRSISINVFSSNWFHANEIHAPPSPLCPHHPQQEDRVV